MTSLQLKAHQQQLINYRNNISHLNSAQATDKTSDKLLAAASPATMAKHTKQQALHSQSPLAQAALQSMLSLCQWDVANLSDQDLSEHF
ncbi:hypothetical protein SNR37_001151 [Agarivorans aestuarii]|uniref:Uncharacterized protein n=1 Tax=Agarivorans aestuarii TaxID=1563703 RepID=A0ABU7G8V3_9ALTE|nr:hypothetical protein [Agarivorans aestuarii]MEE1675824.1 hypothetical protein [Agarivorans aestuarii]